jgi:hypothetical protein
MALPKGTFKQKDKSGWMRDRKKDKRAVDNVNARIRWQKTRNDWIASSAVLVSSPKAHVEHDNARDSSKTGPIFRDPLEERKSRNAKTLFSQCVPACSGTPLTAG